MHIAIMRMILLFVLFSLCLFHVKAYNSQDKYGYIPLKLDFESILKFGKHDFVSFSLDMRKATIDESKYVIENIEENPEIMELYYYKTAIRRYEHYWLPLLNQNPHLTWLKAPKDVAFVWHTHRLNPFAYERTCEKKYDWSYFIHRFEFTPLILDIYEAQSKKLWDAFVNGSEPYDFKQVKSTPEDKNYEQVLHYNLTDACRRRKKGTNSLYPYAKDVMADTDYKYTDLLILSYQMWLLMAKELDVDFGPTKGIDVVWHAHQDIPEAYFEDLYSWQGDILGHDDEDDLTPKKTESTKENTNIDATSGDKENSSEKNETNTITQEKISETESNDEEKTGKKEKPHMPTLWKDFYGDGDGLSYLHESY